MAEGFWEKEARSAAARCENQARTILKLLTPREQAAVDLRRLDDRKRWEHLFSLNVWKPVK